MRYTSSVPETGLIIMFYECTVSNTVILMLNSNAKHSNAVSPKTKIVHGEHTALNQQFSLNELAWNHAVYTHKILNISNAP